MLKSDVEIQLRPHSNLVPDPPDWPMFPKTGGFVDRVIEASAEKRKTLQSFTMHKFPHVG